MGVVLDLGVPDIQGAELVCLLRPCMVGPIVLLPTQDQESDRVAALDAAVVVHPLRIG